MLFQKKRTCSDEVVFILFKLSNFMASCLMSKDFKAKTGLDEKSFAKGKLAKIDKDTGVVNFFPAKSISKNFSFFIKDSENYNFSDPETVEIVKKYTTHDGWFCSKINLLLAADSTDIKDYADFVNKLIWCIRKLASILPIKENRVYRGYECSQEEYDSYKLEENFYIPSFLSSSKNPKKFYQASNHNTLMVINLNYRPNNAFVVTEKYSIYAQQEEEVLFACYSKFRVKKKLKDFKFNNKVYEFYIEIEHINETINNMNENIKTFVCFNCFFN